MTKKLRFGETPFTHMSREELEEHTQRLYAALTHNHGVVSQYRCLDQSRDPEAVYWSQEGAGGEAFALGKEALDAVRDGYEEEDVYRQFFRYANEFLFQYRHPLFRWVVAVDRPHYPPGQECIVHIDQDQTFVHQPLTRAKFNELAARWREEKDDQQPKTVEEGPRVLTEEEVTEKVLAHIWGLINYWAKQKEDTPHSRLEGLAFSLLVMLEGGTELPAFKLIPYPDPDDAPYCKDNGQNWFPDDCDIAGTLHELFFSLKPGNLG